MSVWPDRFRGREPFPMQLLQSKVMLMTQCCFVRSSTFQYVPVLSSVKPKVLARPDPLRKIIDQLE